MKEQQRIKIAEAMGWGFVPSGDDANGNAFPESWIHEDGSEAFDANGLPDYLNDLNLMHEAEKALEGLERDSLYPRYLSHTYSKERGAHPMEFEKCAVFCTAAQRAEAFLRTLGLWEEPTKEIE